MRILFLPDFHGHNTARGARFILGFRMYLILAQTDQVYLILAFAQKIYTRGLVAPRQLHVSFQTVANFMSIPAVLKKTVPMETRSPKVLFQRYCVQRTAAVGKKKNCLIFFFSRRIFFFLVENCQHADRNQLVR